MAQISGLAQRGLILLGLMLAIVAVVGFVLFRKTDEAPPPNSQRPGLAALAVPNPGASFPGNVNWGALASLSTQLPSSPGFGTRYNAICALASHGSVNMPFDVLCQMLDEEQQMRNWRVPLPDGQDAPNEYAARETVLNGIKAVNNWHSHKEAVKAVGASNPELQRLYAAIDRLTLSENEVLRKEAESVKKKINSGKE